MQLLCPFSGPDYYSSNDNCFFMFNMAIQATCLLFVALFFLFRKNIAFWSCTLYLCPCQLEDWCGSSWQSFLSDLVALFLWHVLLFLLVLSKKYNCSVLSLETNLTCSALAYICPAHNICYCCEFSVGKAHYQHVLSNGASWHFNTSSVLKLT